MITNRENKEEGVYVVFLAIILLPILYLIGWGLDSSNLQLAKIRLQRAVDAGAYVAASHIGKLSKEEIEKLAVLVTQDNINLYNKSFGQELLVSNIKAQLIDKNTVEVKALLEKDTFIIGRMVSGKNKWDVVSEAAAIKRPVAISIVLDITGSMQERSNGVGSPTRLELLKSASKTFINAFDENKDAISLVTYNSNSKTEYPLSHPFSKKELSVIIDGLEASGMTNMHSGVKKGREELDKLTTIVPKGYDHYVKVIILITDGAPNANSGGNYPYGCSTYKNSEDMVYPILEADYAREQDIVVFAIAIGAEDPVTASVWQTQPTNTYPEYTYLKKFMMKRLVNDQVNGTSDPQFPKTCIKEYSDISNKPNGQYLESPKAEDINYMLQSVRLSIQTRLIK